MAAIFYQYRKQQNHHRTQTIISIGEITDQPHNAESSLNAFTVKSTKLRTRAGALRPP